MGDEMARYKVVDRSARFLPINLEAQLMVGSFEHALDVLVERDAVRFLRYYDNRDRVVHARRPGLAPR